MISICLTRCWSFLSVLLWQLYAVAAALWFWGGTLKVPASCSVSCSLWKGVEWLWRTKFVPFDGEHSLQILTRSLSFTFHLMCDTWVPMAVKTPIFVFWVLRQCGLVTREIYWRRIKEARGTYRTHEGGKNCLQILIKISRKYIIQVVRI